MDAIIYKGSVLDMGGEELSINIKTNILSTIDKLVGSYTQTAKLPRTKRNESLLLDGYVLPSSDGQPYTEVHDVILLRDGIEIVNNATMIVFAVTESAIEVSLSWGANKTFDVVAKSDKYLDELDYENELGEFLSWMPSEWINNEHTPIAHYSKNTVETPTYQPVVDVASIINKIQQQHNLIFTLDYTKFQDWVIPLCRNLDATKIAKSKAFVYGEDGHGYTAKLNYYLPSVVGVDFVPFFGICSDYTYNSQVPTLNVDTKYINFYQDETTETPAIGGEGRIRNFATKLAGIRLHMKGSLKFRVRSNVHNLVRFGIAQCYAKDGEANTEWFLSCVPTSAKLIDEGGLDHFSQYEYEFVFDEVSDSLPYNLIVPQVLHLAVSRLAFDTISDISGSVEIWAEQEKVLPIGSTGYDGEFFIVPNLPHIKQLDFLKGLMQMSAMFPTLKPDGTILLADYDLLYRNRAKACDWSKNLLTLTPISQKFEAEKVARVTRFQFKGDSDGLIDFDSEIIIENPMLDDEAEYIKLPFSKFSKFNGVVKIPLYELDEAEKSMAPVLTDFDFDSDDEAYIALRQVKDDGAFVLDADALTFPNLMKQSSFAKYVEMLKKTRIIEVNVLLNPIQIRDFDETIPVYFSQFGCYFGVLKIKTKSNNVCNVELIKL